ncbi:hypothetical protein N9Q68_00590 [Polaribacter sp.]|nr:hypothetical protein [Polaribacter sp.]
MGKRTKNNLTINFGLCLAAFLLLTCDIEPFMEAPVSDVSENKIQPVVRKLSYEDTGKLFNKLKTEFQIAHFTDIAQQANAFARTTQDTLGITIFTDDIKEVTLDNYTSYTMRIVNPDNETDTFYNLTIEDKNGASDLFVTKYDPTENWLNDTKQPFEGSLTTMRTDDFTDVFDEHEDDESNDNTGSDSNGSGGGQSTYPTDCNGMVIATTVMVAYTCGCGHWPWKSCGGSTCGAPNSPGYEYVTTYECVAQTDPIDPGDSNDSYNENNPNSGGGGTSGDGGGANPDPASITVLLGPGEECETPPPGDLDGDCEISYYEACLLNGNSQEVCDCVAATNDLSACLEDLKCGRLKRLVQNDSIGSNILPVVQQLRTKLGANNNEWSMSYINKWVDGNRKNVPDDDGLQEGPSNTRSEFSYGNTWVGQIHTHPENTYPIFSWLDLRALRIIDTNSHNDFNDEVFIMAIAPNNVTYALKVENIQTLVNNIDQDMLNAEGETPEEKREYLMVEMAEKYNRSSNLEQTFLSLFGGYGISLYKATDANLSIWKQLELDENDNETVNETPCN